MENHLSGIEERILSVLQEGLPPSRTPYKDMARQIGIETAELLGILNGWKKQGRLRRIGAIVNPAKAGLCAGAMVVWQVEAERVMEVGRKFADFDEVSHAYERQVCENWPYNLYTMVHGRSKEDVDRVIESMSRASGVCEYRVLTTEKELKKAAPIYTQADL